MSAVRNFLFLHVFTALLPPRRPQRGGGGGNTGDNEGGEQQQSAAADTDDRDYYEILGVKRKATHQDVRKAYKVKSLQLHPDKVAQRRQHASMEELKDEYEKVQEAYACLVDPENRRQYHQLGCSNARYKFVVVEHGLYHPASVYHNLEKASCVNKTRLLLLLAVIFCFFLLQPILIAAKVNQILAPVPSNGNNGDDKPLADASWTLVLIPLWAFQCMLILGVTAIIFLVCCRGSDNGGSSSSSLWLPLVPVLLEHLCWFVGNWFLALRWDADADPSSAAGSISGWSWHVISAPFYAALAFRMAGCAAAARQARHAQSTMVSPEKMAEIVRESEREVEEEISRKKREGGGPAAGEDGGGVDDADDRDAMREKVISELEEHFHVVTVDEDAVASALQLIRMGGDQALDEEEIELLKVSTSPEFAAAESAVTQQVRSVTAILFCGFTFVALVACRLEGQINVSWWVVFVPVWVYLGWKIFQSFFTCCCISVSGDPIVIVPPPGGGDVGNDNGNTAEENTADGTATRDATSDDVKASVNFASAEGTMKEFNERAADESEPPPAEPAGADQAPREKGSSSTKDVTAHAATEATETAESADPSAPADGDGDKEGGNDNQNGGDDDDDDDPHIRIDEETFHAWQHAQAQAESSAMEKQAKAQSTCCWATFQLIIVCLIVGKLEPEYNNSSEGAGSSSYSAFWILFPVFVVMGVLLCCCCCLVYSAGSTSLDDLVERAENRNDDDEAGENDPENALNGENDDDGAGGSAKPNDALQANSAQVQGAAKEELERQNEDGASTSDTQKKAPSAADPSEADREEEAKRDIENGVGEDINDLD